MTRTVTRIVTRILAAAPELFLATALVGGWLLITRGIAAMTTPHVWPISIGLLLLSLCGWSFLGKFFWAGLYQLMREPQSSESSNSGTAGDA